MSDRSFAAAAGRLRVIDMHTAGEPVRIFDATGLALGGTILDKRRAMADRFDAIRRSLMLEPRGHADMYGALLVPPSSAEFDAAVLFSHVSGYSTMCGHATIALGRFLHDREVAAGRPARAFRIECPCGPVDVRIAPGGGGDAPFVSFDNVESFALELDASVAVPAFGEVRFDLGYGGAFYAVLPSTRLGLDFDATPLGQLAEAAGALVETLRAGRSVHHPSEPELSFLYGAILTDGDRLSTARTNWNLCWFGEGQIDRSPTGSGVAARLAIEHARGGARNGQAYRIGGPSGLSFEGRIDRAGPSGIVPTISGQAYYTATAELIVEAADPVGSGFRLPERFADLAG